MTTTRYCTVCGNIPGGDKFALSNPLTCIKCYSSTPERRAVDAARSLAYFNNNKESISIKMRGKRWEQKLACLDVYGGRFCSCCGETHIEFLTIDHINGGGTKHRKSEKIGNIYYWLRRNGYPSGYRVLCFNCNCARGHFGCCPHEKERELQDEGISINS